MGFGYYVLGKKLNLKIIEATVQYEHEIDPLWISRQSLDAKPEVIKADCSWLPEVNIRRAFKYVEAQASILVDYPIPNGHLELRQWIA